MEEANLYTILEALNKRKALYLGNGFNFQSLEAFISGFMIAASDNQLEIENFPNFGYFSTWLLGHLKNNFGLAGGWHWQIKNRNLNNDDKAFEEFFHFLEIFKHSKLNSKSIFVDDEALEFNKSRMAKIITVVDGKIFPVDSNPHKICWITISNSSTVWVDFLAETGIKIRTDFWSINSIEAMETLIEEFGVFKNEWVEND